MVSRRMCFLNSTHQIIGTVCEHFISHTLEDFWKDKIASQAATSEDRKKNIELWIWVGVHSFPVTQDTYQILHLLDRSQNHL
jgi:hypothetical protein